MTILIIGTGNMGRAISTRLLAGGQDVRLYNPDLHKAEKLAADLRDQARDARVRAADDLAAAISASDVIILASWYAVNLELAEKMASELEGKIVVDISNPLNDTYDGLVTEGGPSAAENIQAALADGTRLVKAFNTTFAGTLVAGNVAGVPLDVYIAGDDEKAKGAVAELVRSGGPTPIDVGPLHRARQLEGLGLLGITLQPTLGTGFDTAWKLVMPGAGR